MRITAANITAEDLEGLAFKKREDLRYFNKLKDHLIENLITSFEADSFIEPNCVTNQNGEQIKSDENSNEKSTKTAKFKSKKLVIDDFNFDSRLEADFYLYLLQAKRKRNIISFSLNPSFVLQEKYKKHNKTIQPITYKADFLVVHLDGSEEIIDTKGYITETFKIKKKILEYKYPHIDLKLMKYVKKYGGWIEHSEWAKRVKEEKKLKLQKSKVLST